MSLDLDLGKDLKTDSGEDSNSDDSRRDLPSLVIPRHGWLEDHLRFLDDTLIPANLKSWHGTNNEHIDTLSRYYRACISFLTSFGDLIREEDTMLYDLNQRRRNRFSLLLTNVGPSLAQPDMRAKGVRQEGPYKQGWENSLVDRSYKPRKGVTEPATRGLRGQGKSKHHA